MIHRALSVACWLGWIAVFLVAIRIGWHLVIAL